MGRIEILCSYIDPSESFADVGCDHGYCAEHALSSGKCKSVIVSDVSAKSLNKAEILLKEYIERGVCRSVCCDGLKDIPRDVEQVLVAGMGGEEIIKIFKESYIPRKFILQPMKNAPSVRAFLVENGCKILCDDLFYDGKYYFVIKGERGGGTQKYSQRQLFFGRDSLNNPLVYEYAESELNKKLGYIEGCGEHSDTKKISKEIALLKEMLNDR